MRHGNLLILAFALATEMVCAGPYEDAAAAYSRDDYATALRIWRPLADRGHAGAQTNIGFMYAEGQGVPKDEKLAVLWYRKAAEQGDAIGQYNLGVRYALGKGVPKDDQMAVFWYRKAAELGYVFAQASLGDRYAVGRGIPKDDQMAVFWYLKAAEQGNANAQINLGHSYSKGEGVAKDARQAVLWYRRAAAQGDPIAQYNLGVMYSTGQGVPKDDQQSIVWYHKAAAQGDASAQGRLGFHYAKGIGLTRDFEHAYFWLLLAVAGGDTTVADLLDLVERVVTPKQRAEAQAAARTWKPDAGMREASSAPEASAPSSKKRTGPISTGTGFYVAPAHVVTNHHVTEGCQSMRIGNQTVTLSVVDSRNDLALISMPTMSTEVATIREGRVKIGESALVAGFPLNGLLSGMNVTTGNVSSLAGPGGDTRLLQMTAPVQAGNSGGPLIDMSGNVMGVVASKLNALNVASATGDLPQNVNFAINANVLTSFLDANGIEYNRASSIATLAFPEIAKRAQAFTVLVECWQ